MKRLNYILCASFLACTLSQAQDKETRKAEKEIKDYAYADAIETYEKLVKEGYEDDRIFKNLGNAYYLNANYHEAAGWYAKLFSLVDADVDSDDMYRYAQTLKSNGNYEESRTWMQKFEAATSDDVRARKFSDHPDYLEEIERRSGRYTIENLPLNSAASDFAPSFGRDFLVFSTARDTGTTSRKIHGWNNKPFLNLYKASTDQNGQLAHPTKLSKGLNRKTHESSTAFTKDGTTMYFTRNNSENGKFSRDKNGVSRLKIYRATLQNEEWKDITELPFNSDAYSNAHPALSADENQLYFASDRKGSLGQSDIFVVDILTDGTFSTPKNLGDKVNTEARETFPFITESNVLYFASDGHPGLGGLDVFAVPLYSLEDGHVVNVGKPVNSAQDDFSFIFDEATDKGFFASNREGGMGDDDIYGFTETDKIAFSCKVMLEGTVKDDETGEPIAGTTLSIFNSADEKVSETISGSDGTFIMAGDCATDRYKIMAIKEAYDDAYRLFPISDKKDVLHIEIVLNKTNKSAPIGTDLFKHLELQPILFDSNKAEIRPDTANILVKIINYMQEFPNTKIQVRSHTDALGKADYNLKLSDKRAQSTIAFFVSKGIDSSRLSGEGFGENELLNDCGSEKKCSSVKHQENRRSEFVVVE